MKRRGAGTIGKGDLGQRVLLQAWVQRRRDHGGLVFLDLRDRSGVVQVVVRPESRPLRFVFVGNLGARKGLPLLLDVWCSLGNVHAELWLVGSLRDHLGQTKPDAGLLRKISAQHRARENLHAREVEQVFL